MKIRGRLTLGEAAAVLGIHRNAVGRWIASGKLAATREGRVVYVEAADLRGFLVRECPVCRKTFEATDARQRYCGDRCQWSAANRRRAERLAKSDRHLKAGGKEACQPTDPATLRKLVEKVRQAAAR